MPYLPSNSKCATLGCNNNRSRFSTYCLTHGGRDEQKTYSNKKRAEANNLYKTGQWQKLRIYYLSINPICAACKQGGIITPATEVDHLFPWNQIGREAFYNNLFQTLCKSCHTYKTGRERAGIITSYLSITNKPIEYLLSDYARIVGK